MNRRQVVIFNVFALMGIALNWILSNMQLGSLGGAVSFIVGIFIILVIPGVNIVYVIERMRRRCFDEAVFSSLALLSSLIVAPSVTVVVFKVTNYVDKNLILAVYLSFLLLPFFWDFFSTAFKKYGAGDNTEKFSVPESRWRRFILHPITIVLLISAVGCLYNLTRYEFLATPDSYSWLIEFENELPSHSLSTSIDIGRMSFTALVASFFYITDVSLFALFKYVLPFLSLLTVPAMWLVARELPGRVTQTVFMFATVFVSPTVLLELGYARQQIIFLLFLYFTVGLSVYSALKKDKTIFYLIGGLALMGVGFHQIFSIFILPWLASFLLPKWRFLWRYQFVFLLLAVAGYLLLRDTAIGNIFNLAISQAAEFFINLFSGNWNMLFPVQYANVDEYEMGWKGLNGLIKYYAYYAGPVSMFVLLTLFLLLISRHPLFKAFRVFFTNKSCLIIFILLLFFFFVAEIAPRFGNIAYLPDRVWQYIGILLMLVLFILLRTVSDAGRKAVTALLILSVGISYAGAAYVNHLTKYTVPDYELAAAKWIRQNTSDSYFFSGTSKNVLRYHADKRYVYIDESTYTSENEEAIIESLLKWKSRVYKIPTGMNKVVDDLTDIEEMAAERKKLLTERMEDNKVYWDVFDETESVFNKIEDMADEALVHTDASEEYYKKQVANKVKSRPVYIYYAKTHPKNPYSGRPYKSSFTTTLDVAKFPALDQNEDTFTRVYEDGHKVIIWKVDTKQL